MLASNTAEVKASLDYTNTPFNIDIAQIIQDLNIQSKQQLTKQIQQYQEQLTTQLCGPKYSRNHSFKNQRAGTYKKTLTTALGTINFRVQKIKSQADNTYKSPILECLAVKRRKYTKDLRMQLAEYASKMSYGDASLEFETATNIHIPKRTIHRFVHEIAPNLLLANNPENKPQTKASLMGDTTEVRALASREMNMVHVLISPDNGQLLHLAVNKDWPNCTAESLISDKEPALTNAVAADNLQLCILHAIKYLLFTLWGEGMSKDDREKVKASIKEALFTLVNSTKKHLKDKDTVMLQERIDKTLKLLDKMAEDLQEAGYTKAADFLKKNSRFVVTFAQLALQGVKIPYTTNRIERLMGEVSKRCKHKWMHWSTQGLNDILTIVLVRYTNQPLYDNFKKAYIHNTIIH